MPQQERQENKVKLADPADVTRIEHWLCGGLSRHVKSEKSEGENISPPC